jgi:hypothetical protein
LSKKNREVNSGEKRYINGGVKGRKRKRKSFVSLLLLLAQRTLD